MKQKKFRQEQKKVLIEGLNLISQLLENKIQPIELIVFEGFEHNILERVNCKIYSCGKKALTILSEIESPQPIIGVIKTQSKTINNYNVLYYLDGIHDPTNLGTIFRTATALGIDGIALSEDCCDIYNPKVIRASLGSVFWLPSSTVNNDWLAAQKALKLGLIVGAKMRLTEIEFHQKDKVIVCIGSEAHGLSAQTQVMMDCLVSIPIKTQMESLNAATAAAIAGYEVLRGLKLLT